MVNRDPKTNRNNIRICPRCKGNGYFTVKESVDHPLNTVVQCPMCNSEGEVDDPNDDVIITADGVNTLQ